VPPVQRFFALLPQRSWSSPSKKPRYLRREDIGVQHHKHLHSPVLGDHREALAGRSSGSRITLLTAPSRLGSRRQWALRLSFPVTAAGLRWLYTIFPLGAFSIRRTPASGNKIMICPLVFIQVYGTATRLSRRMFRIFCGAEPQQYTLTVRLRQAPALPQKHRESGTRRSAVFGACRSSCRA